MPERTVTVASSVGLHARPASLFSQAAAKAGVPVTLTSAAGKSVNAASILGVLLIPASRLRAQESSTPAPKRERWQVTLEGERYVWDIGLVRLDGDSLVIRQADTLARLPVEHITEIRLIQSSAVDLGAGVAGAMSALTGADDEIYDLTTLEFADRIRTIQKIFVNHPAQR